MVIGAALLVQGCTTTPYLLHVAGGHLEVLSSRRPIDAVIADPDTPPPLSRRLEQVELMRRLADTEAATATTLTWVVPTWSGA